MMLTKLVEIHLTQVLHFHLLCRNDYLWGWIYETIPEFESEDVLQFLANGQTWMLRRALSCQFTHFWRVVLRKNIHARASCQLVINCGRRRILDVVIIPRRLSVSPCLLLLLVSAPTRHLGALLVHRDLYR